MRYWHMVSLCPATFEEFAAEAARPGCNLVPVVRTRPADMHTPVSAFLQISKGETHAFLLESIEGGEHVGRYSFVGARPRMVVRGEGDETLVRTGTRNVAHAVKAVDFLRDHFKKYRIAERAGLPPLAGGAIGFFGYEAARWFEPILQKSFVAQAARSGGSSSKQRGNAAPDALFLFCDTIVAQDHVRQLMTITTLAHIDGAAGNKSRLRKVYANALAETARVDRLLSRTVHPPSKRVSR